MDELEAKIRIFEAIANNSRNMCSSENYMTCVNVAHNTNMVYDILKKNEMV